MGYSMRIVRRHSLGRHNCTRQSRTFWRVICDGGAVIRQLVGQNVLSDAILVNSMMILFIACRLWLAAERRRKEAACPIPFVPRKSRAVARASLSFAERLGRAGISVDRASLLRGALLHDYFLYDWHDPDPSHRLHGFRHPFFALARAEEDFELTPRERNIIVRHMFPLVPVPPTCREAWIVCLADKWCALRETVAGRLRRKDEADDDVSSESNEKRRG